MKYEIDHVPATARELAHYAAEDMLLLHALEQGAPPPLAERLQHIQETITRLATFVFATLEEGDECALRIQKRVAQHEERLLGGELARMERGRALHEIFGTPKHQIGFRLNGHGSKG